MLVELLLCPPFTSEIVILSLSNTTVALIFIRSFNTFLQFSYLGIVIADLFFVELYLAAVSFL